LGSSAGLRAGQIHAQHPGRRSTQRSNAHRFFFTEEDDQTRIRATDIRSALVAARHQVWHGKPGEVAPPDTDVWMHGLGLEADRALDTALVPR
jgi:hypothetical protein